MSKTYVNSLALAFVFTAQLVMSLQALGQVVNTAMPVHQYHSVILAVTVNGLPGDLGTVFLQDENGHLYAPASFFTALNLRLSELRILDEDGAIQFDLDETQGLSYSLDPIRAEIAISAAPSAFLPTRINIGAGVSKKVALYTPGAYLNYDLSLTQAAGVSANQALFDIGLFRGEGLLTSSFTAGSTGGARLMSTYQTDQIDSLKTLRIGDGYNSTGAWGRAVLYGGIQYGANFAIRPDFVSAAMPRVSGKALLPSTVDVYVNNALRTRQNVNAGPFSIQNLPVITGTGEVQVVVKDLLGHEQLITQSYFVSPNLLREGLVDDSYEFGWLRQNYGLTSNDYSDPFATVTYRKGLTNNMTGEARIELEKGLVAAGGSAAATLPAIRSEVESSLALSDASGLSPGAMTSLGYNYLGRSWSANARLQLYNLFFRQLGSDPANLPQQIGSVHISAPLGHGTMSVSYLRHLSQGQSMTRIVNFNYSQKVADGLFASFILLKTMSSGAGTIAEITLTKIFDQKHFGSSTLYGGPGAPTLYTDFQQAAPRNEGTGYRLAVMNGGDSARQEASVTRNQSFGSLQADLVRLGGDVNSRLSAQGGIDVLGDGVYFSRGHDEGFAIIEVKDIPGVSVYLENQLVAHTDQRGRAVVSNLLAYQKNHIRIDPLTLPMEASVNDVEKIVIPRSQGGVLVDFEVLKTRSAILRIVQTDGNPLPPWTPVEVAGMERAFVSGNRGEVFVDLPNLKGNRVTAHPAGSPACELSVDLPDSVSTVPFLGPLTCVISR